MINPHLNFLHAQTKQEELRRAADAYRRHEADARPAPLPPIEVPITLRFAFPDDTEAVARLAQLDRSDPPEQPVLVAEVSGKLRAALSLADGRAVADPFYPTVVLVQLLERRARHLTQVDPTPRPRRWRRRLALRPRRTT